MRVLLCALFLIIALGDPLRKENARLRKTNKALLKTLKALSSGNEKALSSGNEKALSSRNKKALSSRNKKAFEIAVAQYKAEGCYEVRESEVWIVRGPENFEGSRLEKDNSDNTAQYLFKNDIDDKFEYICRKGDVMRNGNLCCPHGVDLPKKECHAECTSDKIGDGMCDVGSCQNCESFWQGDVWNHIPNHWGNQIWKKSFDGGDCGEYYESHYESGYYDEHYY